MTSSRSVWTSEGPATPHFRPNPGEREDNWLNAGVQLVSKWEDKDGKRDGWLVYRDKDPDNPATDGVGGYNVQLRYSTTTPRLVDGARAAAPSSAPTLPAATKANDEICFIASAVDNLGNESSLPSAGSLCATDDPSNRIRAGVDITAPTVVFTGASLSENVRISDATLGREYQVQVKDGINGSGFGDNALLAALSRRHARGTVCGGDNLPGEEDVATSACMLNSSDATELDDDLVTTVGVSGASAIGYYTFTAIAQDKAGNRSDEISRMALLDHEQPQISVGAPSTVDEAFDVRVSLDDDLSIRDYYLEARYDDDAFEGDVDNVRIGSITAVDSYNADPLTRDRSVTIEVDIPLKLQRLGQANLSALESVWGHIRDQASSYVAEDDNVSVSDDVDEQVFTTVSRFMITGSIPNSVSRGDRAIELEAVATSTDANSPFSEVVFYAEAANGRHLVEVASVPGISGRPDTDDAGVKTWTYTTEISAASLLSAVGQRTGAYTRGNTHAVATGEDGGVGLVASGATQPVDPGPAPLAVSMTPQSASIAVGGTFTFAVNVTGGGAETATIACTSSNVNAATVEFTVAPAGTYCVATGVAAGESTITATATKGGSSMMATSTLTVTAAPNNPATGQPTITGTAQVGQMLTAGMGDIADADGIDASTVAYQWISNDGSADNDISGATSMTYGPVAGDVGNTLKVRVSFRDGAGNDEARTSNATATVTAAPTATLSGLTVSVGGTNQITFASGTTSYDVDVAHDVATVDVDATAESGATATVSTATTGASVSGNTVTLAAAGMTTVISVEVSGANFTSQTYTINVERSAAPAILTESLTI